MTTRTFIPISTIITPMVYYVRIVLTIRQCYTNSFVIHRPTITFRSRYRYFLCDFIIVNEIKDSRRSWPFILCQHFCIFQQQITFTHSIVRIISAIPGVGRQANTTAPIKGAKNFFFIVLFFKLYPLQVSRLHALFADHLRGIRSKVITKFQDDNVNDCTFSLTILLTPLTKH